MSIPVEMIISDDETLAESGFYWRERDGVKVLVCSPLEEAGFVNGFSTRLGGVSDFPENSLNLAGFDEDAAENIYENRRRFLNVFEGEFNLATAWQVHGDDVKTVANDEDISNSEEKFDALVSDLPNTLVGVKTADCVPILIGDPATRSYAAIHSGWKGTAKSIVVRALEILKRNYGADPKNMIAAIGSAASGKNYEIGQDVIDAFLNESGENEKYFTETRPGHALVDLNAANRDKLIAAGIPASSIFISPFCTMQRSDLFFSYRVEKKKFGKTGRLLAVIGLAVAKEIP
ncbi:MAG: peptidoglycan editing factor PgeF [Pyrinomonadaceae bacterium]